MFSPKATHKDGVSRTYHQFDAYAPIAFYLSMEGWYLRVELWPGSQHGPDGFVVFLQRVIKSARVLVERELLVVLDSAHDAIETLVAQGAADKVHSIVKRNPRSSSESAWRERVLAEGMMTEPREGKKVGLLVPIEKKKVSKKG